MRLKRVLVLLLVLVLLAAGGAVAWFAFPAEPLPQAMAAMEASSDLLVRTRPWLVFRPVRPAPTVGLILYPGARIHPGAYAPAARQIAAQGYLVAIVPMPLNLAVLDANRAAEVMQSYPEITRWAIGGHSLGGAMAARFAYTHPDEVRGLVLWAAYPAASDDLSTRNLAVSSLYGTRDGLSTVAKIDASRVLLPPQTQWAPIQGGNHAQFGWYGAQAGDQPADISREEQQRQVVAGTLALLEQVKGGR